MIRLGIVLLVCVSFPSLADSLRLEGDAFKPGARIVWTATNTIPFSLVVYRVVPRQFSNEAISNFLKIVSFTTATMKVSPDKQTMSWRGNDKNGTLVRSLDIAPSSGCINYFDTDVTKDDPKHPVTGVPSYDKVESLAAHYLQILGGDTNELSWKPQSRTELDSTSYNRRPSSGGKIVGQSVQKRGIMLCRQIDGIRFNSPCGRGGIFIGFGSHEKISDLQLNWRNLKAFHRYKTLSKDDIIKQIKDGKAVVPDPGNTDLAAFAHAKRFNIVSIVPRYWGEVGGAPQDYVYPFAEIKIAADLEGTNTMDFVINSPILSTDVVER